jgi:hypothetical protein
MTAWPEPSDLDLDENAPAWERQPNESTDLYAAFRIFRDQPAHQRNIAKVAEQISLSPRRAREWAVDWNWRERAAQWDDACHRIEDQERLEAIRSMHKMHRSAGRAAIVKAMQALQQLTPDQLTVGAIARFLDLGAKLERSTLIVSVEELQGIEVDEDEVEDPWERIAAELDPHQSIDEVMQ